MRNAQLMPHPHVSCILGCGYHFSGETCFLFLPAPFCGWESFHAILFFRANLFFIYLYVVGAVLGGFRLYGTGSPMTPPTSGQFLDFVSCPFCFIIPVTRSKLKVGSVIWMPPGWESVSMLHLLPWFPAFTSFLTSKHSLLSCLISNAFQKMF